MVENGEGQSFAFIVCDANNSFMNITGSERVAVIGRKVSDVLPRLDTIISYWYGRDIKSNSSIEHSCSEFYHEESKQCYEVTIFRVRPGYCAILLHDISERKFAEEKIRFYCFHDQLTGLYNRRFFEEEMNRLDSERFLPISIIMADLNGLKLVNDTYGHSAGDEMLKETAEILRDCCRAEDIITRLGGDEFVVFLPNTNHDDAAAICDRIKSRCSMSSVRDMPVSVALGVAVKDSPDITMIETLSEAETLMYRNKYIENREVKNNLLTCFINKIKEKGCETEEHIALMMDTAFKIGRNLALPESELRRLRLLITLHDIGIIGVYKDILMSSSSLTTDEWSVIKKHPEIGYRITRATEEYACVAEDILSHHERWDGKGYPRGLKGEGIPLLARITTIADAYEVMTSGRPYKEAVSQEEALAEIIRCAGTQFDPALVKIFLSELVGEESDYGTFESLNAFDFKLHFVKDIHPLSKIYFASLCSKFRNIIIGLIINYSI